MNEKDLRDVWEFAVEAAQLAGALTLGYFQTNTPIELKADRSPVTAADRGAEELLRKRIEKAFPRHGILGEEFGEKPGEVPARWILDPVDGTYSFISGVPLYSTLIGFEWQGEVVAGVIHLPALKETVYAARGLGCWWNGRRARVTDESDIAKARVSCTNPKLFVSQGKTGAFDALRDTCADMRGWADAYGYACLATGRVEIVVDPIMNIWDNAALLPVVQEAGGVFTDWSGSPTHKNPSAVATNGKLHDAALKLLQTR